MALLCLGERTLAQENNPLTQAQYEAAIKNYDKAIELYKELYKNDPDKIFAEYTATLVSAGRTKDAESVVQDQISRHPQSPELYVQLGRLYHAAGKDKKADEQYQKVILMLNGDDMLTQRVAQLFTSDSMTDYAIATFERARVLLGNPYFYAVQLAQLYSRQGNLDKTLETLLAPPPNQYITVDNVKAMLLQLLGNDAARLQAAQKNLIGRINNDPGNVYYAELLTWIYTQKNDWDGALMQVEAIDERNNENGARLMNFARGAAAAHQYDAAVKGYEDVMAKGAQVALYAQAWYEKLNTQYVRLQNDTAVNRQVVAVLMQQYDSFLTAYPAFYGQKAAADYAAIAAQYADSVDKAIHILQVAVGASQGNRQQQGSFKLQLGDYYLLAGKIWDASLLYSQVDKDFKNDAMGEDARFRNAKLAYYRGDFEWAQKQLSVLKASTSELIANDALYLSVQITENVEDSNYYPLSRFAYAGLLLFCNRDAEAEALLDSISTAFPKHPLNDDILMLRAQIELKHQHYNQALVYLKKIYELYGKDVLADDALFMIASIYEDHLHDKDNAKHYYVQLILDFPGSTFVQSAREQLAVLDGSNAQ